MKWLLAAVPVLEILLATLRVASRASYLLHHKSIDAVNGTAILPSQLSTDLSDPWLWIAAFRHGVDQALHTNAHTSMMRSEFTWLGNDTAKLSFVRQISADQLRPASTHDHETNIQMRVKSLAVDVFSDLRWTFGIPEHVFEHSLIDSGPYVSFGSNSKGTKRVGGIFFYTHDGAYLIKTVKADEVALLLHILPQYQKHMRACGKRSLLTRICAMVQVDMMQDDKVQSTKTFIVMNSVFPPVGESLITQRYDLKGSTIGRRCSRDEIDRKGPSAILKDLDLIHPRIDENGLASGQRDQSNGFCLRPRLRAGLLDQLARDVDFLWSMGVIDYSLLVGVAPRWRRPQLGPLLDSTIMSRALERVEHARMQLQKYQERSRRDPLLVTTDHMASSYYLRRRSLAASGRFGTISARRSGDKQTVNLYLGLIDFLQPFDGKKYVEWRLKKVVYGKGFSCVPPDQYARRFLGFTNEIFHS